MCWWSAAARRELPRRWPRPGKAAACILRRPIPVLAVWARPGCYITGQAAGVAAALTAEKAGDIRSVDVQELRSRLRKMGAFLPERDDDGRVQPKADDGE